MATARRKRYSKRNDPRDVERFKTDRSIKFVLLDGSELKSVTGINDLSESGVQFTCREFVKKNSKIKVVIDTGHKKNPLLVLTGRVAWVETASLMKGANRVGLSFMGIRSQDQEQIRLLKKKKWFF